MPPADRIRLRHMLEAIEAAERFRLGRTRLDLDSDEMLRFALVRAVEIVGEAAAKVTPETRARLPLPWPAVVGMRNRLIHAYFDIDHDVLWATLTQALPALQSTLGAALAVADDASGSDA